MTMPSVFFLLVASLVANATVTTQAKWTQLNPTTSPSARTASWGASDGAGMYMFGGEDSTGARDDLWYYDGQNWIDRTPLSGSPPGRRRLCVAWDVFRSRLVLFGGHVPGVGQVADTWEWDGVQWTQMTPAISPPARQYHRMAFDPLNGRVLLFGGVAGTTRFGDTWAWDGTNWTQLRPTNAPSPRERPQMATDFSTGQIVLFGGRTGIVFGDTWVWDGSNWNPIMTATTPFGIGVHNGAFTYDLLRQRMVAFGGVNGNGRSPNTWEFDGVDWLDRGASTVAVRNAMPMEFVAGLGRTIMFGGYTGTAGSYHGDTWEYQTNAFPSFTTSGTGCAGSAGVPTISATRLGWLGGSLVLSAGSIGGGAQPFMFLGFSKTVWAGGSLPFPLTVLGFPNCMLQTAPDLAVPAATPVSLAVPNSAALIGGQLFAQVIAIEPPFTISMSALGEATIGAR